MTRHRLQSKTARGFEQPGFGLHFTFAGPLIRWLFSHTPLLPPWHTASLPLAWITAAFGASASCSLSCMPLPRATASHGLMYTEADDKPSVTIHRLPMPFNSSHSVRPSSTSNSFHASSMCPQFGSKGHAALDHSPFAHLQATSMMARAYPPWQQCPPRIQALTANQPLKTQVIPLRWAFEIGHSFA